jgi:hypothetical protein
MPSAFDQLALSAEELVALLVATSFAAGLNVYATIATLGLLHQFEFIVLPPALMLLSSWWVIGASATLYAAEFVIDKIPVVDLIWDALHTFIRVPMGALLAYGTAAPLSPEWQMAAGVLGGLVALAAHGGKMATRAAVTPSPEPFSNIGLSLAEDALAIFLTWFATRHPFIAASIVLVLLVVIVVMIRWVVRALRALFRGARRRPPMEGPLSPGPGRAG